MTSVYIVVRTDVLMLCGAMQHKSYVIPKLQTIGRGWNRFCHGEELFRYMCYTWRQINQNLLIHNASEIQGAFFWQLLQRWEKWSQSWKPHPGGIAEIKNITWCIIYIFNFSSAIRGHFSNVSTLFTSMDPLSKKTPLRFLKDGLVIKILSNM